MPASRPLPSRHPGFPLTTARILGLILAVGWLAGCRTVDRPTPHTPATVPVPARVPMPSAPPLAADRLEAMDAAVGSAIAADKLPGGVLWMEHRGRIHQRAYGQRAVEPRPEPATPDTVFDAASLTKVLATTPAVMKLVEQGRIGLDDPVAQHLPGFAANGKEGITSRHLLTHTSGLRPGIPGRPPWTGTERALELAAAEKPTQPPGTRFVYSDINFIVLGELVRTVAGVPLDAFVRAEVHGPLGMADTGFRPFDAARVNGDPEVFRRELEAAPVRIAPTERITNGLVLRGIVHDPTARRMGGVAGHAGLFTTAADVARFARMMLGGGTLDGRRVFSPETVAAMTSVQTAPGIPARGLGWDIDSPYAGPRGTHFPVGSYGHTGWTGTSLWIDPASETFIVFLSNRNHPTEDGDVRALRRELGTLAAEALPEGTPGRPVARAESASGPAGAADSGPVLNGIDVIVRDGFRSLRGLKVGLITNHTGHDRERRPTIDLLAAADGVELVALFSPEHGIRGLLDEKVDDGRDEKTGLPVYSLYGERRTPAPEQLAGLDALVFDIQYIGCRFYTYISTLANCIEAAGTAGVRFIVLDRVNPVNGRAVDGPVLTGARSFVASHEIPLRHGMTVGELARMFHAERSMKGELTVVPVEGWRRDDWFDATGLPWTNPSPNMRSLTEATLYPGVGVLEFCNVSVGRGTGTPF